MKSLLCHHLPNHASYFVRIPYGSFYLLAVCMHARFIDTIVA